MGAVLLLSLLVLLGMSGTKGSDGFEAQIERIIDLIGRSEIPQEEECVKADIAFVLDVSSSVRPEDVKKMKAFVKKLISGFEVGQDMVRVAVVSFNRNFRIDLYLDQCEGPADASKAVDDILGTRTGTLTHKALDAVRTMVFVPSVGDRPDAPNIVVVITDGRSGNEEKTKTAALKLKATGAIVFSIGIGRWVSDPELQVIANKPATKFSKLLDNFDELTEIQDQFKRDTCQTIIKPPNFVPECDPPLFDIAFILDASTSISEADFQKMKEFVVIFMSSFEISPKTTRFAVILFSAIAKVDFNFDDYSSYTPMKQAVSKLTKLRAGTFTNKALDLARTEVFKIPRIDSTPAKKITIVITDGRSRKRDETEEAATKLKETGVEIIAVGVGHFNTEELHNIASSPGDVFEVDNFENLKSVFLDMVKVTCKDIKENKEITPIREPPKFIKECDGVADVLFLVEIPKSDEDFTVVKTFIEDVIGRLVLSEEGMRVAITLYAKKTFPILTFGDLADSFDVSKALNDFELPENRQTSFKKVSRLVGHLADMGWRREGVRKILVTMFIGNPSEGIKPALLKTYAEMKKRSFGSVVINMGVPWEEGSLMLASNPKYHNAIFVPRFDALTNVVDPTVTQICDVMDKDK